MKFLSLILSFLMFFACATTGLVKYPDTPIAQATLLMGALHDQVDIYLSEVTWAVEKNHIDILNKRLAAIQMTTGNMKQIEQVVSAGGTIPEGLIISTKANLTEMKRWLYSRQEIVPSKEAIEEALKKAHLIPEQSAQAWESIVLLLIELIQAFSPMMDRLISMGNMTPEQMQAEYDYQATWLKAFDPYALPVVGG